MEERRVLSTIGKNIALTGGAGHLGVLFLQRAILDSDINVIHVLDIVPPPFFHKKIRFHKINLTDDLATEKILSLLEMFSIKTFIHSALFSNPVRKTDVNRKEVETIGTFHILNAISEAASVEKLILFSSTFIYGASPSHNNFILETQKLPDEGAWFVRSRIDVEQQVKEFSEIYQHKAVTILRFAPVLGPHSYDIRARYFLSSLIPKILGQDPLLQFIHEEDAAEAQILALKSKETGVFNIVGKGIIPLSTGIHLAEGASIPIPSKAGALIFSFGKKCGFWDMDPELISFFEYLCVADGTKAESKLKFSPKYSSRQALKSMLEIARLQKSSFSHPVKTLGEDKIVERPKCLPRLL